MTTAGSGSEKTSVQVALRIRPITTADLANLPTRFQRQVLTIPPNTQNQVVVQAEKKPTFSYDHVFGPDTTQKEVYEAAVLNLVDKFMEGYNVTILAYGQTSSGKTFTMGTADNTSQSPETKGIIPRAMATVFSHMNSPKYKNRRFTTKVSFIEIYNEELIDLLGESYGEERPQVTIREDTKGKIIWNGLQEFKVNSADEVMSHLTRGSLNRQVGATDMNAQSSRSHAIFSVTLTQQKQVSSGGANPVSSLAQSGIVRPSTPTRLQPPTRASSRIGKRPEEEGNWVTITSKFHFVDLAGSERLKRTSAVGERAKEGISINSGLLALGNVISALGDPNKAKHTTHIPYRDSKLTRLLQDSLGGNAQTLMIACVSPAEYNLNETINTLKYANRARNIKNTASVNQEEVGWHDLEHLQSLVLKLRAEIKSLKAGGVSEPGASVTPPSAGQDNLLQLRRASVSSSAGSTSGQKNADIDAYEEQLMELRQSYFELSQKYAKLNAELAKHQDNAVNADGEMPNGNLAVGKEDDDRISLRHASASFQAAVEPVIEEYERSISALESRLAIAQAALNHSENLLLAQESKIEQAKQTIEQNGNLIADLGSKLGKLKEREASAELYIKDLENKLERHADEQKKDQDLITDLRSKINQMKNNGSNSEGYIQDLETRLSKSEEARQQLVQTCERLEKRLQRQEESYQELEDRLKEADVEADKQTLLNALTDRNRRITQLEKKVEELINEVEKLRKLKEHEHDHDHVSHNRSISTSSIISDVDKDTPFTTPTTSKAATPTNERDNSSNAELEGKLADLQRIHGATVAEYMDVKTKYQACLDEIADLQSQLQEAKMMAVELPNMSTPRNSFTLKSSSGEQQADGRPQPRRARSLGTEIRGAEDYELNATALLNKLQGDHLQDVEAIKEEFAHLQASHREALQIIEKLKEEIKLNKDKHINGLTSAETGEVAARFDLVKELAKEVNSLKERQRLVESLAEQRKSNDVLVLESEIETLKGQLHSAIKEKEAAMNVKINDDAVDGLESKIKEMEEKLLEANKANQQAFESQSEEMQASLRQNMKNLEKEIEIKNRTINSLLLPFMQQQDTIKRLESELQEAREQYRLSLESVNEDAAKSDEFTDQAAENQSDAAEKLRQMEEKIKSLESQLDSSKASQTSPNSSDVAQKTVDSLKEKLSALEGELAAKSTTDDNLQTQQETIASLQTHLDELNADIKRKHDVIEVLKRDLLDKNIIQKQLLEKEEEAEELKEKLRKAQESEENLVKEMQELKTQLEADLALSRKSKDEVDKDLQDLKDAFETQSQLVVKLESEIEILQKELYNTRNNSESGSDELNELSRVLNKTLQQKEELEVMVKQLEDEISTVLAENEKAAREQLNNSKLEMQALNDILTELENQLSTTERQRDESLQRSDELTKLLEQKDADYKKATADLELALAELQREYTQSKQADEEKISHLEEDITQVKSELAGAKAVEEKQTAVIHELEEQLGSAEEKHSMVVAELEEQLRSVTSILENESASNSSTVEQLQASIENTRLELENARVAERAQTERVNELETKLAEAELKSKQAEEIFASDEDPYNTILQISMQHDQTKHLLEQRDLDVLSLKEDLSKVQTELEQAQASEALQVELVKSLEEQMKQIELELAQHKSSTQPNGSNALLTERINVLEAENEGLEQANRTLFEERGKLDQKVESLIQQLQASGSEGNSTAAMLAELNLKINSLENELVDKKQKAQQDSLEMEREIGRLLVENERLDRELKDRSEIHTKGGHESWDSGYVSLPSATIQDGASHNILNDNTIPAKVQATITQQNVLIKSLQEKIADLERRNAQKVVSAPTVNMQGTEIDAMVNAARTRPRTRSRSSSFSSDIVKRTGLRPAEVQKLQKKIAKLEGESVQNSQLVSELENEVTEYERELRTAKQQLDTLRKEKTESSEAVKKLRLQLENALTELEKAKSVQEEKRELQNCFEEERKAREEERKAKEKAERARLLLESRMEELIAKRTKIISMNLPSQPPSPPSERYGNCRDCGRARTIFNWCHACESQWFQENFSTWTSGNEQIDAIVRASQENAKQGGDFLEWIPFDQFELITYHERGGFGAVYKAIWLEGPRSVWDEISLEWRRLGPTKVALKRLDNSCGMSKEFLKKMSKNQNALYNHNMVDTYGITRDMTGCYMFVMKFYEAGNLYDFIDKKGLELSWQKRVETIWGISEGLELLHRIDLIHGNLHGGNVLVDLNHVSNTVDARIADVGLNGPADSSLSNGVYGVLPYIAPEILLGQEYTKAADIYSFGVIMWSVAAAQRPFDDNPHNERLAYEICYKQRRPEEVDEIPKAYSRLMMECWDEDQSKRPSAAIVNKTIQSWIIEMTSRSELGRDFDEAQRFTDSLAQFEREVYDPVAGTHYVSRLLRFPNLRDRSLIEQLYVNEEQDYSSDEAVNNYGNNRQSAYPDI
ncbi:10754_t:CDS:2 [Paraglomus occultum]|uniref:10754_t:CDS:1 n=1 Tax=Paraglomus occultum TaxID=144539 RepID=A0A9N9AUL8_9GLOM|nr:10754_t:CDS:2 [Paraglomus occultum]